MNVFVQEKLEKAIDNPQPSVAQKKILSLEDTFINDYFKNEFDDQIEFTGSNSINGFPTSGLCKLIVFNKAKYIEFAKRNVDLTDGIAFINYSSALNTISYKYNRIKLP